LEPRGAREGARPAGRPGGGWSAWRGWNPGPLLRPAAPCPLRAARSRQAHPPPPLPSVGGLAEGLVVELSNGNTALVVEAGEDAIKLDANNLGAGKTLLFELEILNIARQA
jgi:hypothetical protein